jgi:hypothetical protein
MALALYGCSGTFNKYNTIEAVNYNIQCRATEYFHAKLTNGSSSEGNFALSLLCV